MNIRFLFAVLILSISGNALAQPSAPKLPPSFSFSLSEAKFGAQSIGVQSCVYVTITNKTPAAQIIRDLYVVDDKDYSVPSPSRQMYPISIQPNNNVVISVCFKPLAVGDHNTKLMLISTSDTLILPIQGKGLRSEDFAKLPKTDVVVEKPSKKHKEWTFKVQLVAQAKVTMQLLNDLGTPVQSYLNNDLKPEGVYEYQFNGEDKDKKKLPEGTYYLRSVIDEIGRNNPLTITRLVKIDK